MKTEIVFGIFAILLLGGFSHFASAQTYDEADHVVINEVETNPGGYGFVPGNEWVELYNPTDQEQFIGGWQIASTTVLQKKLTLSGGQTISPGQHLLFSGPEAWFTNVGEKIELRSFDGTIIDETPLISDTDGDSNTWQLKFDGIISSSIDDWKFVQSTSGFTNGVQTIEIEEEPVTVTVTTDKEHYNFFDTAIISGSVSEQIYNKVPSFFEQESIDIIITGPNYYKTVSLFPDRDLNFATSIKLQTALGLNEGTYDVNVSYDVATANTQFTLGVEVIEAETVREGVLVVSTDKESYIPGDTMSLFAETSEIIPLEGLYFEVINADGIRYSQGTLFPTDNAVNNAIRGGDLAREVRPDAQFSTTIFMDRIEPVFGTHRVTAQYGEQFSETTFELLEDVKEDVRISLQTDKIVYAPGDDVVISGRVNNVWVPSLNLDVVQTQMASLVGDAERTLRIKDGVRVQGDGSFSYEFNIPNNRHVLGEARVVVSENVGRAVVFFNVVENPELFDATQIERLSISTDKTIYEIGEKMQIIGRVGQIQESSVFLNPAVDVLILDETGQRATIDVWRQSISGNKPTTADLYFTGVPDKAGSFVIEQTISRNLFEAQEHRIVARYADGKFFDSTNFKVVDPLDLGGDRFEVQLNKEVFGLGETVFLDGIVPGLNQANSVTITLLQPDGVTRNFGAHVDNDRFSWSWQTPLAEKNRQVINERSVTSFESNFGVYQLNVGVRGGSTNLYFKVSENPDEETLDIPPLEVTTDKPIYNAGESVTVRGVALPRPQGHEGLVVPDRVTIDIRLADFPYTNFQSGAGDVYLDTGGNFQASYLLPPTVVAEGNYLVSAKYGDLRDQTIFAVDNEFVTGGNVPLVIILSTDKDEYSPGETVQITGRPSKIVNLDNLRLHIIREDSQQVTCSAFICGKPEFSTVLPATPSGTFSLDYTLRDSPDAAGVYEVDVDAQFGIFSTTFKVGDQPAGLVDDFSQPQPVKRFSEKVNRIPDTFVPLTVESKTIEGVEMNPRVISGSLLISTRGTEPLTNLKVSTEDGTCIIGPEDNCQVTDSTRAPGTIYQVVQIDGMDYNVRYSGPDARLEKFSILPSSSDDIIPDSIWNIEVISDGQATKLYHKITFDAAE